MRYLNNNNCKLIWLELHYFLGEEEEEAEEGVFGQLPIQTTDTV